LKTALSERRNATARWLTWATEKRPSGPLVWLHAASVGELMAVVPVLERLRAQLPDVVIIHTFTSPSVVEWPVPMSLHRSDYAPQDNRTVLRPLFEALQPSILLISRGDLWPGMARCARQANVPIAVVGGTIRPSSLRLRLPGRAVLQRAARHLAFVGAVSKQDAERWRHMGVQAERVQVTGDPRDARILERPASIRAVAALEPWAKHRRVLVAGSTHDDDERVLARMFTCVARNWPDVGLLVVPHDPHRSTPAWADPGFSWSTWRGSSLAEETACVFAPVQGALADLYLLAHAAYVGGGFGRGAHSVAEPVVYGTPVAAGPRAASNPETDRFSEAGAIEILDAPDPAQCLARWWMDLLDDDAKRWRVGLQGRAVMDTSAAQISVEAVLGLMRSNQQT